jgi:hypothetical protein
MTPEQRSTRIRAVGHREGAAMKEPRRVLVCGGRDYADVDTLCRVLDASHKAHPIAVLIHGAASGADDLASEWAASHGILISAHPANWQAHGKLAGPIRNQRMLNEQKPDIVIAFPGGKGTADMCKRARKAGLVVLQISAVPAQHALTKGEQ